MPRANWITSKRTYNASLLKQYRRDDLAAMLAECYALLLADRRARIVQPAPFDE